MDSVGIGISAPQRLLDVNGRARIRSIPVEPSTGAVCFNQIGDLVDCRGSSLRWKTNVQPFADGLNLVRQLRPISYNWKDGGGFDIGLAAEEVAQVAPFFSFTNEKGEVSGVKYERLNMVFINAFKEQQTQIESQQTQIERQRTVNQNLQTQVERQQREIDQLKQIVCTLKPDAAVCKETNRKETNK